MLQIFKLRDNDCKITYTLEGVSEIFPNIYILLTPFIFPLCYELILMCPTGIIFSDKDALSLLR
jgi:hypothetical protein